MEGHTKHTQSGSATPEEIRRLLRESNEQLRKNALQMEETDRRLRKAERLLTDQWGELMERLAEGGLTDLLQRRGIDVDHSFSNVKGEGEKRLCQFDIVALNSADVVVVEVKTTLNVQDVRYFLGRLEQFTGWFGEYKGRRILGAVAYLRESQSSATYAQRKGLYVIRATGKSAGIINRAGFTPKEFS